MGLGTALPELANRALGSSLALPPASDKAAGSKGGDAAFGFTLNFTDPCAPLSLTLLIPDIGIHLLKKHDFGCLLYFGSTSSWLCGLKQVT